MTPLRRIADPTLLVVAIVYGIALVVARTENAGSSDTVHRWVLDRMLGWEDAAHARAFGAHYIGRLLDEQRTHAALVLAAHLRDDKGRMPVTGRVAEALEAYARSIGRHRLADDLGGDVAGRSRGPSFAAPGPGGIVASRAYTGSGSGRSSPAASAPERERG